MKRREVQAHDDDDDSRLFHVFMDGYDGEQNFDLKAKMVDNSTNKNMNFDS